MRYFHERLPTDHPCVLSFNHRYLLRSARRDTRTLGFQIRDRTFYPVRVPTIHLNLVIGITATPLPEPGPTHTRSPRS